MNHAGGHHRNGKNLAGPCWLLAQRWQQVAHETSYSVTALSKSCGISVRTLERLFQRVAGQPAERWLKLMRMRRALELLRDGCTVQDVAACLAYEDTSRFLEDFKEHYGCLPPYTRRPSG